MGFDCPICLDFYSDRPLGDFWVSTDCGPVDNNQPGNFRAGHVFHKNCLQNSTNCPICRYPIDTDNVTRLFNIDVQPMPDATVFDHELKIAILGKYKAGKSSIIKRFARNVFDEIYTVTEGIDFFVKFVKMGDKRIKLNLWDTAGQERHRSLVQGYVRNAFGLIFAYDITERSTFDEIQDWVNFADDKGPLHTKRILVGNKLDLEDERQVSVQEGQELARNLDMNFLECSAKESYNIPEIFRTLSVEMLGSRPLVEDADKIMNTNLLKMEVEKKPFLERLNLLCC